MDLIVAIFKLLFEALCRLLAVYLVWVVTYTVLEHFVPGLAKEIILALGKCWDAIFMAVAGKESLLDKMAYGLMNFCYQIWTMASGVLPYLKF